VARVTRRVEGSAEAVEAARTRAERWEAERARITPVGEPACLPAAWSVLPGWFPGWEG